MEKTAKIYIAGHRGMVGSAIERKLNAEGYHNIIHRTSNELDLRNQDLVNSFFLVDKPDYVILAAAKVGGIHANNTYRAEFIYDNLMMEANIIHAAYLNKVKKLLFLGSSCIYPKNAPQPLKEEYLLSGYLESTNQPYAVAKIAGIEMCDSYRAQYECNFISAMPTNLYGTNDNYHPENSHVLPALIRRIILAKKNNDPVVTIWGTGTPRREFMHVDDLADACYFLLQNYDEAAAKVGGIHANNTYRAEFIYDNLMMEANIIHAAYLNKVKKLLFLGSSCIYPKNAPQPLKEEYLLSGYLESTNQPYAVAKIAGIEMCDSYRAQYECNFISAMPTNLYGTNDNYHPENSHVLPALIRRIILAKKNNDPVVTIWGTGTPRREFMHVDDLADACYFLLQNYDEAGLVNIGWGEDVSIKELATLIASEVGYTGSLEFDTSKPDGTPRKLMDTTKINNLGWKPTIKLQEGIAKTINEVQDQF